MKRSLEGSNLHSLTAITGFEPDKHANLARLRGTESGWQDSNLRLLPSEGITLARLSYTQMWRWFLRSPAQTHSLRLEL